MSPWSHGVEYVAYPCDGLRKYFVVGPHTARNAGGSHVEYHIGVPRAQIVTCGNPSTPPPSILPSTTKTIIFVGYL